MKNKGMIVLVIPALLLCKAEPKRFHSIAGPFKISVKRIEKCPPGMEGVNATTYDFRDVRTKVTDPFIYSGHITSPFMFNNDLEFRVMVASWSSMGGWKENAHVFRVKRACAAIGAYSRPAWNAFLLSVYGEILNCPYYPGTYRFENITASSDEFPWKQFFYGRWRAEVFLFDKHDNPKFCIRGFVDTVPV